MGVLKDFGDSILDSTQDIIDAFGDNIENKEQANAVRVEAAKTNIAIAKQRFAADQARKERLQNLIENLAYVGVFLMIAWFGIEQYKKIKK